jgi:hypothetical protein
MRSNYSMRGIRVRPWPMGESNTPWITGLRNDAGCLLLMCGYYVCTPRCWFGSAPARKVARLMAPRVIDVQTVDVCNAQLILLHASRSRRSRGRRRRRFA